jgi:hypothetical protein
VDNATEPSETPPEPALEIFTYRPAGFESAGCFIAGSIGAAFNALNLLKGYMSEPVAILISVGVNLIFAATSGLVWCLVDEVKIGEDKIFETLYWQHPRSGGRRVLKQYEYWRSDYSCIRVQHGRGVSIIMLHGKGENITLDRIFADRKSATERAQKIAEQLDLPLLPN